MIIYAFIQMGSIRRLDKQCQTHWNNPTWCRAVPIVSISSCAGITIRKLMNTLSVSLKCCARTLRVDAKSIAQRAGSL